MKALRQKRSLAVMILLSSAAVQAQPLYTIKELPPVGRDIATFGHSINDQGAVVGLTSLDGEPDSPASKPVMWSGGATVQYSLPKNLPTMGSRAGVSGKAAIIEINNAGIAIGAWKQSNGSSPLVWNRPVEPVVIAAPQGLSNIQPLGINDLNIAFGNGDSDDGHKKGWIYDLTTRKTIILSRHIVSFGNNKGQYLRRLSETGDYVPPFEVVNGEEYTELSMPEGLKWSSETYPVINDSGLVAAWGADADPSDGALGWGSTCITWQPHIGYAPRAVYPPNFNSKDQCAVLAVNNAGDLLIRARNQIEDEQYSTTFWLRKGSTGEFVDLKAALINSEDWTEISHLADLNSSGAITGYGKFKGKTRGLVISPVVGE